MRSGGQGSSPERKSDRLKAERAAEALRLELGLETVPTDPFAIAEALGIQVSGSDQLDGAFSGCLLRSGGQFGILYSSSIPSEGFRRFTISHEIGHHQMPWHWEAGDFFPADGGVHHSTSDFTSRDWREGEADAFAAELLMPRDQFLAAIRSQTVGRDAIRALADRFQTSLTSTAIRYASLTPDQVAVVVSENGRVLYAFPSASLQELGGMYLAKGTPVPRTSATGKLSDNHGAVMAGQEADGSGFLGHWFENPGRELAIYEDALGLGSYGRVLTVLYVVSSESETSAEESDWDDD